MKPPEDFFRAIRSLSNKFYDEYFSVIWLDREIGTLFLVGLACELISKPCGRVQHACHPPHSRLLRCVRTIPTGTSASFWLCCALLLLRRPTVPLHAVCIGVQCNEFAVCTNRR
jgi:hypothetical protein